MESIPVILDGGFGTELQKRGLPPGVAPESWNVTHPDVVRDVHAAYFAAGAEAVVTNAFGANPAKYRGDVPLADAIAAGVARAREAAEAETRRSGRTGLLVAADLGPTGRLIRPAGDFAFEEAYDAFAASVKIAAAEGADFALVETMGDTREIKAAVLAVRDNTHLPVWVTVALGENGQLLTGADVETVAALLEGLRVDACGFNCGLGPEPMLPYVERLARVTPLPIVVKPNAGLPRVANGRTTFSVGPAEFADRVERLVAAGASVVGGCCGTTPAHVRELAARGLAERLRSAPARSVPRATVVSSGSRTLALRSGEGLVIGERINPTGKRKLKEALLRGDVAYVLREAVAQQDAGACALDVNAGVPGLDEAAVLDATVEAVQGVSHLPVQIDTANPVALARAWRHVDGKPLVNSVNGTRASMEAVLPLAAKFGGVVVALTLDENGIPPTAEGRVAIAERILAEGRRHGLGTEDFAVDALTLAISAQADAARVTLETVKLLTERLGVNTVLGVSNVSFGLPDRPALNNAMYALAKRNGLSAAIANPAAIRDEADPAAVDALLGRDLNCERWIARCAARDAAGAAATGAERPAVRAGADDWEDIRAAIRRGLKEDAERFAAAALSAGAAPLALVDGGIVPALEEVGAGFEAGRTYLPQLLMAADAAGAAFAAVRAALASRGSGRTSGGAPIVLATVKGDVHDIGKNIVRALLENYGFDVVDLGRDVAPEAIVAAARRCGARLVGLSALMTTTAGAMADSVALLRRELPQVKTCVGGAVITADFAASIGADFYSKTAMDTVRLAQKLA